MGAVEDEDHQTPLLDAEAEAEHPVVIRTGSVWTAVAHVITGVIGSGVLSLAWSMAQLGWIAGPICMLLFAAVTLIATHLLCNSYLSPDPELGPIRNRSYLQAVNINLGKKSGLICGICVQVSLYGTAIAYTITSAISMRAIQKSNCYHKEGHEATCSYSDSTYILIFGLLQLALSQSPDFHNIQWLSIIAAVMSFTYSSIGFGLGLAKTIENGYVKGTISGIATSSEINKVWLVAQALGDIAFAYPYSQILIEIQDTLKAPPPENQTMQKASAIAISITTLFYLGCGCFGYAAFGDATPGNLLTGFGFYEPYWLIDFANACIVLHLLGGYQVYSQPLFGNVERWLADKYPESRFINHNHNLKLPFLRPFRLNLMRLCFRTVYVISTTVIALIFPYFNQVIGVLGALTFWPLTIFFPVEMYLVQSKVEAWTRKWVLLRAFSIGCLVVTSFALVGCIEGLVTAKLS